MIKQLYISDTKNVFKTYKASILKKIKLKKKGNEMYREYIMNAIKEGEEYLANGGKTYTLEESKKRMEQLYGIKL